MAQRGLPSKSKEHTCRLGPDSLDSQLSSGSFLSTGREGAPGTFPPLGFAAKAALKTIQGYQALAAGGLILSTCRFFPSCSYYAIESIQRDGFCQGIKLMIRRLMKCHPWHPGGWDPLPGQSSTQE